MKKKDIKSIDFQQVQSFCEVVNPSPQEATVPIWRILNESNSVKIAYNDANLDSHVESLTKLCNTIIETRHDRIMNETIDADTDKFDEFNGLDEFWLTASSMHFFIVKKLIQIEQNPNFDSALQKISKDKTKFRIISEIKDHLLTCLSSLQNHIENERKTSKPEDTKSKDPTIRLTCRYKSVKFFEYIINLCL